MGRFAITVAYDGTAYNGWQVQPEGHTVQGCIEQAFEKLCNGIRPRIQGSGRTDTGVHARGQVFHVNPSREDYAEDKWREALNGVLPKDIRIREVRQVSDDFHARYHACSKEYRYFIYNGRPMPPDLNHYRLEVTSPLDREAVDRAAALLAGTHDFTAFSATRGDKDPDPVRTLHTLQLEEDGEGFFIRAVADGFLYKMVRRLTGALLQAGAGGLSLPTLEDLLRNPRREADITTAPPHGLFLWRVMYD